MISFLRLSCLHYDIFLNILETYSIINFLTQSCLNYDIFFEHSGTVFSDQEEEVESMLEQELWKPELFKEYKAEKEAEKRAKMAESGRSVILRGFCLCFGHNFPLVILPLGRSRLDNKICIIPNRFPGAKYFGH